MSEVGSGGSREKKIKDTKIIQPQKVLDAAFKVFC